MSVDVTGARVEFEPKGSIPDLAAVLENLDHDPSVGSLVVFASDANGFVPEQLDPVLAGISKPVIGGIFPAVLHDARRHDRGTVVLALPFALEIFETSDLSALGDDTGTSCWAALADTLPPPPEATILFVDALSGSVQTVMEQLYDELGIDTRFIGGGAGSLSLQQAPCVFSNRGLRQEAAVLGLCREPLGVGVTHGWEAVGEPMQVTEASGNRLRSVNWEPALDWYIRQVSDLSGNDFSSGNFFENARNHPLGILSLGGEVVVRDLLASEGTSLVCVSGIEPGAIVQILTGDTDSLLSAAQRCRHLSLANLSDAGPVAGIVVDCISRALFLDRGLDMELASLWCPDFPIAGALTIGEVAGDGVRAPYFHNKTTAVGCFGSRT